MESKSQKPRAIADLLHLSTRYFFFTGKGGVGKTSIASSTALALADSGKRVLLISTDPASNLDEVLRLELSREPRAVPFCEGLFALNIDPEAVAAEYREKVVGPMRGILPEAALKAMEEQLSGACTMEIAAFDEFTGYLGSDAADDFDVIVFDTAPTGHTLRLMALSQAWTHFLDDNTSGNSCLGPLAGLEKQRHAYAEAVEVLKDVKRTAVFLVSRASKSPLKEARRTWNELKDLGIENQSLVINGWYEPDAAHAGDLIAQQWRELQSAAMVAEAEFINLLPLYRAPLLPGNLIGTEILRGFYQNAVTASISTDGFDSVVDIPDLANIHLLADQLASAGSGVIMTMGKGGVGKTTVAAALAIALADRGARVRLSTTDPAAHIADAVGDNTNLALTVERIDPKVETAAYVKEVLAAQGADMDAENRALLEEDLRSPCTEEIAVFRAFARTVAKGEDEIVVLDTAPTGHTLLLLDATQSYHRELGRQTRSNKQAEDVEKLLPRLRDPEFTRVLLVTLAESTPVHEAAALQADLRRAEIEPYAWIINQSLAASSIREPLLAARGRAELPYIRDVIESNPEKPIYLIPWSAEEPSGLEGLRQLCRPFRARCI
jgi:arsenite-transporting ATPase